MRVHLLASTGQQRRLHPDLDGGNVYIVAARHGEPGVSPKVLTRTLRRLEDFGFVSRTVYPAVPARVEYALTDLGRSVSPPLAQLRDWVEKHADLIQPNSGHASRTSLEVYGVEESGNSRDH